MNQTNPLASPYPIERLEPLAPNVVKVRFSNGNVVLYSYDTPVAVYYAADDKWYRSKQFHSVTTSKHIRLHAVDSKTIPAAEFAILVKHAHLVDELGQQTAQYVIDLLK